MQKDIQKKLNHILARMEEKEEVSFPPPADSHSDLEGLLTHSRLVRNCENECNFSFNDEVSISAMNQTQDTVLISM